MNGRLEIRASGAIDTAARDANLASRLRGGRLAPVAFVVGTISLFLAALAWMPATRHREVHFWPNIAIPAFFAIVSFAWLAIDSEINKPRRERNHFTLTIDPSEGLRVVKGVSPRSSSETLRIADLASIARIETVGDKIIALTRDGKRQELQLSIGAIAEQQALADRLNEALINARSAGGYRGGGPPPPHVRVATTDEALDEAEEMAEEPTKKESFAARVDK